MARKAVALHIARRLNAGGDHGRGVAGRGQIEVGISDRRHFDAQIKAVHQGARDAAKVIFTAQGHAGAGAGWVGEISAFAGVGGGDKQKAAGITDVGIGACNNDVAGFDGLAQGFQDSARKFGEFVHEKNAVVGQADLSRFCAFAAANDGGHGGSVVRFAKRAHAADAAFAEKSGQGMHHRGFKGFDR